MISVPLIGPSETRYGLAVVLLQTVSHGQSQRCLALAQQRQQQGAMDLGELNNLPANKKR